MLVTPQISHYSEVFNTPTKSQGDLQGESYQTSFADRPDDAICLKRLVEYIQLTAEENFIKAVHERQWGTTTIGPIFNAIAMFHQDHVRLLNLESCAIQPIELRPERREGGRINLETESFTSNDTSRTNQAVTTSRMIDYGFGLRLDSPSYDATQDAFACLEDSMRSLNQSLSYFDRIPLLLDIEIKKTHSNRTPEVQLGIWQAAGYAKRKLHGWSTTMPMPGICINGHDWVAYITFEDADDRLIAMGPIRMGNTSSIRGIWEVLYKLDQLLVWGETEYGHWFEKEIMPWVRATAAGS